MMSSGKTQQIDALDRRLANTDDPVEKARIYLRAGKIHSEYGEVEEACFFMTQAFVFAADHGDKTVELQARRYLQIHDRI